MEQEGDKDALKVWVGLSSLERIREIPADTSLFSPRRRRHPRGFSVFVDQQNTSRKMKKIFSEMLFDRKLLNLVKKW